MALKHLQVSVPFIRQTEKLLKSLVFQNKYIFFKAEFPFCFGLLTRKKCTPKVYSVAIE